ncbi:MAG: FAD-binding oxidoreductase [Rhodocyclaceae bacterium]
MPEITLTSGAHFSAEQGTSILDASVQARTSLPYSCKTGRCSTCKCKVVSGDTTALQAETGLSEEEKADGWILSCVRTATTDVTIEVEDLGGVVLPVAKTLPCRISAIERLAPDVMQVRLRLPPTADFNFIPGQYVDIIGPGGLRRSYSLAKACTADKVLELHIRAVDGGAMSQYWFNQAKLNDLLRLNGPLGTFFLRDSADLDLIFLATGTGIAPVKAMLESMADLAVDQRPRSVTVLWGGRTSVDLYLDMEGIGGQHAYIPVLSRGGSAWVGARGYVQDALLAIRSDLRNTAVYACGSDAMIHSAKLMLTDAGLPLRRFYSDAFVCSAMNSSN